ncbi:MAG: LysM peptidoglycan-binding domain-containing protein, partial [Ardenticatenaceae bacterium]
MRFPRYALLTLMTALLLALAISLPAGAAPPRQGEEPGTERAPGYYVVKEGDTLSAIAARFDLDITTLAEVNQVADIESIFSGQRLIIPGSDGSLPAPDATPVNVALSLSETPERDDVVGRMTRNSRRVAPNSPFYKTTWVTYYGRPTIELMGILGEYSIEALIPRLQAQAAAYDEANGPELGVMPAFHLVYGMALSGPNEDGSYLSYLSDERVLAYIEAAQREG